MMSPKRYLIKAICNSDLPDHVMKEIVLRVVERDDFLSEKADAIAKLNRVLDMVMESDEALFNMIMDQEFPDNEDE